VPHTDPLVEPSGAGASSRLLALFEGRRLTPTQRRIGQQLVEHAGQAAFLSSGEVAELAGVSQPSVTRFATALGFDGYPALRRVIRTLVTGVPSETPAEARRNEWQRAVESEVANLHGLAEALADPAPITQAARLLVASRPLVVLGLRAAAPLASYFGYFGAKVHPDVRVIDAGGSTVEDTLEQAKTAGATALVGFVLPRYPQESLEALRAARRLGLATVTVTDTPMSPLAEESTVLLHAAVGSRLVFDSHAAPMVLAMVLLQAMCDAAPAEAQSRLEEFEYQAAARQLFVP
jgi:DNA-binding MurR/RpiR family transcriptional regulator